MADLPETADPETCARFLRELGSSAEQVLPIAEAALALASFERPRVDLGRYRDHLRLIARDVGRHRGAGGDLVARAGALNDIILLKYGYSGDELTYDDLQNLRPASVINHHMPVFHDSILSRRAIFRYVADDHSFQVGSRPELDDMHRVRLS